MPYSNSKVALILILLTLLAGCTLIFLVRRPSKTKAQETSDLVWYFAYGSNMDEERLRIKRGIEPVNSTIAMLRDYKLLFNKKSKYKNCSYANIVSEKGSVVYGVLYLISRSDLGKLDVYEGYPTEYYRIELTVETLNGSYVMAWTYIANRTKENLKPCEGYANIIVRGARRFGLPEDYINYIIEAANKP